MTERYRLGRLKMGKAWHDGIGFSLGNVDNRGLEPRQFVADIVALLAKVQPNVRRHLIVTRAASVKLFARFTDALGQS